MAIAKVVFNGTTLMDVTNDTVVTDKLVTGYTATQNDGTGITGSIAVMTASNLSVSGKTVTAPAGYYASSASTSVAVGEITSGSATISSASYAYSSANGNFNVTGSAPIPAPTVNTDGYVSSSEGTKNESTASLAATVAKIAGSTAITTGSGTGTDTATKKPVISVQATPSGVTDASNGDATTTAPSSGVYVAVKSAANTGKLTATPSVSTSGYGTSANHGITARTATYGAAASDTTYVPIATTTATVSGDTVSYGTGWISGGSKTVAAGSVTLAEPSVDPSTGIVTVSATVTAGYVSSSTPSTTLSLTTKGATTYNVSTSEQSIAAGTYLTGKQTILKVTTSNIDAANIKKGVVVKVGDSGSATRIKNVTGTFTTTPSGKTALTAEALRSGYSGFINGAQVDGTMADTSVSQGTSTISGTTVTRGVAAWNTGYITSGSISAATFANEATTGSTYLDISSAADAPVLVAGDYLYINKGYTDNLKISLAKLVPDGSDVKGHGDYILSGHSAYDNDGTLVAGTIQSQAAQTIYPKSSDQTIASGKYLSGTQTIKAVTTSGISNGNIRYGATVKVGDSADDDRITAVAGTFTKANTVSSGQTAASASEMLSGYSAWVDGAEVKGSIASKSSTDLSVSGKTVSVPAGYYSSAASANVDLGSVTSGTATISSVSYTYSSGNDNFAITGSANVSAPTVGSAGYISATEGTRSTNTGGATVETTVAKIVGSTTISGSSTKTPSISKQAISISGVTDAAGGSATTTAPSSGVYVAVQSAKSTGTLTATPSVTTAGYGDETHHGIAVATKTVGANASAVTYVPIATTSATVNGDTVSYGSGWITEGSKTIAAGAYNADSSASSNSTVTPSVGLDSAATSTYGFTTTKPSGTTGTNFLTIDPGASATAWSVTPQANITTAGYLATGSTTGTAVSNTPSIAAGTNYYVPIRTVTFSGGDLSTATNTNTVATTPVVTVASSGTFKDSTDFGVTTTKPSGTDGTDYLTIDGSGSVTTTGKATSTVKVDRAAVTYTNSAGAIAAHNATSAVSAGSSGNITKDVNITPTVTDNFAPLYIPVVSATFTGGGLTNTNYSKSNLALTLADGSDKNVTNYTVGAKDTTNYPYYVKVSGSTPAVSGTTKVDRAAITYSNAAGAIEAHNAASVLSAGSSSPTVSVNATSNATYVGFKSAVITGTSTNATATTTVAPGNVTIAKQSTPSGVTNAASGNATTTTPSSGVYVAVLATAAANSTGTTSSISGTGTATVSSAGYAADSLTGAIAVSGTATAKTSEKSSSLTYVPITTATPVFTGGGLSGTATASSSTALLSDTTNNSGVSLATACTATRADVTYNGAVAGWVSKSSGATAYAGTNTAMTAKTYYINGVTLATPSSGSRTFTVTAPSGGTNHTYTFTQGTDGRTTIQVDNTLTMAWNAADESLDFIYS